MAISNEEFNRDLLKELQVSRENGMRDSSMINILETVFCNIPDYLSNPIDEKALNVNGSLIDTSVLYENAEIIIDSILRDPLPDFEYKTDTTSGNSGTTGKFYKKNSYIDKNIINSGSLGLNPDLEDHYSENREKTIGKSAIIEFGCETKSEPAVEYKILVKPGEAIDENTIIGQIKQKGLWKPIRSIFSKGIIRKTLYEDFGRLYSPVCTRHIVVDNYELASNKSFNGINIDQLIEDPTAFLKFQDILDRSEEAINIIIGLFPYLMYLRLVSATAAVLYQEEPYVIEGLELEDYDPLIDDFPEEDRDIIHYDIVTIDDSDFGVRVIFDNNGESRLEVEDEFSRWIENRYEHRKEEFIAELEEIYGGFKEFSSIKASCGETEKLKAIADKILEAREKLISDIFELIKNPRFTLPIKEKRLGIEKRYWYTSMMRRKFRFKVLKTLMSSTLSDTKEKIKKQSQRTFDYDILNPTDEEYQQVTNDYIKNREYIDLVENDMDFEEFFKNLSMCTYSGGIQDLELELIQLLEKFSKSHESGDARESVEKEIKELKSFLLRCIDIAGGISLYNQESPRRIKKVDNDDFLSQVTGMILDEAEWPLSTDYEYRGETYKKYTFLNLKKDDQKKLLEKSYMTPEESSSIQDIIGNLEIPDADSVNVDPEVSGYYDHGTDEGEGLTISEITIDDFEYWRRYLGIATIVGLIPAYWATGLILPSTIPFWQNPYLMLPCIFIPIKEFSISKCGLVVVLGLAIRGLSISLLLIVVNMSQQHNSLIFPATFLLTDIRDQAYEQVTSILDTVPMICNGISNSLKSNNVALLKQNKKFDAEMAALKSLKVSGANSLIRGVKEELDIDPRMIVNRLESDIRVKASDYKASVTSAYSKAVTSFSKKDSSTNT